MSRTIFKRAEVGLHRDFSTGWVRLLPIEDHNVPYLMNEVARGFFGEDWGQFLFLLFEFGELDLHQFVLVQRLSYHL